LELLKSLRQPATSAVYKHVLEPNPLGVAALSAGAGHVASGPVTEREPGAALKSVVAEDEQTLLLRTAAKATVAAEVRARLNDYEFRYYSKLIDAVEDSDMFLSLRGGLGVCLDLVAKEQTRESVQRALECLAGLCLAFIDLQRAKGQHSATEEALLLGNASKLFPTLLDSHVRLAYAQQAAGQATKAVTAAGAALNLIDERLRSGAKGEASVTVLYEGFNSAEGLRALREEMCGVIESVTAAGAKAGGPERSQWRTRVRLRTLALTTVAVLVLLFLLLVGGARSGTSKAGGASAPVRATVTLRVSSDPEGAALYVAGAFMGRTPAAVEVPLHTPVAYKLVAPETRYRPFLGTFGAAEDKNISVWLDRVGQDVASRSASPGESDGSN
jgi:hypothetical protein